MKVGDKVVWIDRDNFNGQFQIGESYEVTDVGPEGLVKIKGFDGSFYPHRFLNLRKGDVDNKVFHRLNESLTLLKIVLKHAKNIKLNKNGLLERR